MTVEEIKADKKKMTELRLFFQEKDLEGNCLKDLLVKDKVQAEIQRGIVRIKRLHPNGF